MQSGTPQENFESLERRTQELQRAYDELTQTQTQLLQSEKLASIGQLAAGVAHEINNPVGFIIGNLGVLKEYIGDFKTLMEQYRQLEEAVAGSVDPDCGRILKEITATKQEIDLAYLLGDLDNLVAESLEGAERVRKIVQDLKNFSHVDRDEVVLADINAGIESTLNIVWNELKYKATVEKKYGDIPQVMCHPMELNQVFMNLLVNASQAIEEKGCITIETLVEDGVLCIRISDTGKGMPPQVQKQIFDPFFTTKPVGEGTGLGLSMSYNIVKKHEGVLLVDSEEGKGTTFTIKIPLVREIQAGS